MEQTKNEPKNENKAAPDNGKPKNRRQAESHQACLNGQGAKEEGKAKERKPLTEAQRLKRQKMIVLPAMVLVFIGAMWLIFAPSSDKEQQPGTGGYNIEMPDADKANRQIIGDKANIKRAESYDPVVIENQLVPEKDENGYWTFTTDRDLKIMQLTDIHLGGGWLSLKKDSQAINAVATMIQAEKPDLVIITGDMAFPVFFKAATFNNKLPAKEIAALMEHLGVYWTVAFGNHDTEAYSYYSREQISDFYGNSGFKYCLFQKGPDDVDGYGNQVINVKNSKGILTQSLYIFDSHSYTDGDFLGMMWKYDNIHENQVQWYRDNVNLMNKQNNERLKELGLPENSDVKSLAFFHIPLTEQRDAWYEYMANGFKDTENVKYVYGKAGEGKKIIYCGMGEDDLFETIQELGSTKGLFFGHDHDHNFSIYYKGIRMTYG